MNKTTPHHLLTSLVSLLLSALFFFASPVSYASDMTFNVTVDKRKVSLGSSIELRLDFKGETDILEPKLPAINGFDSRYLGPHSNFSFLNGKVSKSITHVFKLLAVKEGKFIIPSLTVEHQGKSYASGQIEVEVIKAKKYSSQSNQDSNDPALATLEDRVFLRISLDKKIAYVNEKIPLTIKLYVNDLPIRYNEYPKLENKKFLIDEVSKPLQYQEAIDGVSFQVLEFKTNIYPLSSGELILSGASFACTLVIKKERKGRFPSVFDNFDSFFTSYEQYPLNLQSNSPAILVNDLPSDNLPKTFTGAIGDYAFKLDASPKDLKAGDPITLRMTIEGEGNFKTVKQPILNLGSNFKIYDSEVKKEKNSKIFERVIIPRKETISQIPEIEFSFFNPDTKKYEVIVKGPIPIKVTKLDTDQAKVIEGVYRDPSYFDSEKIGRDIIFIKESVGAIKPLDSYLYKNKLFIFLESLIIIILISLTVLYQKTQKFKTDIRYARKLLAPKKAKNGIREAKVALGADNSEEFFNLVFKTLRQYLGDKLHLATAGITVDSVVKILEKKINNDILEKVKKVFGACDLARYAPHSFAKSDMEEVFKILVETIDCLERKNII